MKSDIKCVMRIKTKVTASLYLHPCFIVVEGEVYKERGKFLLTRVGIPTHLSSGTPISLLW